MVWVKNLSRGIGLTKALHSASNALPLETDQNDKNTDSR